MKHFKLIFNRFMETEGITIPIDVNTSGLTSGRQKVTSETKSIVASIEEVINANEKLAKTSSDKRIGNLRLTQAGINRFNTAKDLVTKLSVNPHVSAKTKVDLSTMLSGIKSAGLDNLKEEFPQSLDRNKVGTMMSMGNRLSSAGIKAAAEEQKYYNNAAKEGLNILAARANADIKAQKAMEKEAAAAEKLALKTKKADDETNKFTATMKKLAGAAVRWRILYGAFSRIWNVLSSTVDKAAAYEEAINLYTIALGNYADEASEWRDRISTALYLDPKYVMQYTGALYNLVQGLGVSEKAAYTMSTNLTQLAYDMSSYLNIDVESAYAKIQSAMTGQSRAVASAGIAMQQASLGELAWSLGIKTAVSDMTQAEKTYLRYIQIMRSTVKMQGDLGRTIVTPENSLRIIRQQFEMLARAIGQVFIPIIMKAIPYVMALTQVLTELATRLAHSLGFELAQIDYDSITTADTAVEDAFNNMGNSATRGSKAVKDSINRTLAAFDELNVVESESAGSGGIGDGGASPAANIKDLEPYITGYDMLKDLTADMDEKVGKAKENLLKFWDALKKIAAVLAVIKGIKILNNVAKFIDKIKEGWVAGKGLSGGIKKFITGPLSNLITKFKDGYTAAANLGKKGLGAIGEGLRNMLGPVGSAAGGIAAIVGSFSTARKSMRDFDAATDSAAKTTAKTTAIVTGLTVAGGLLLGPVGAVAGGIAGLSGLLVGAIENVEKYKKEVSEQIAYNKLFDGIGISTDTISKLFDGVSKNISNAYKEIDTFKAKVDSTEDNVKKARDKINELHEVIVYGFSDDNTIDNLKIAVDNFKDAVNQSKQANIDYYNSFAKHLHEQGYISDKEYKDMTKHATDYYTKMALLESDYSEEFLKIQKKYKVGTKEYDDAMKDLELRYLGLIDTESNVADGFTNIYTQAVKKIDLKNPKELEKFMDNLNTSLDTGQSSIKKSKEDYEKYIDGLITQDERAIKSIQKRLDEDKTLDEKDKERLKKNMEDRKKDLITHEEDKKKVLEGFEKDSETLNLQYLNFITTILAQIEESGADSNSKIGIWAARMKKTLEQELGDNTDISKAGYDLFGEYVDSVYKSGGELSPELIKYFKDLGITLGSETTQGIIDETARSAKEDDYTFSWNKYIRPELRNDFYNTGAEAGNALNTGIGSTVKKMAESGKETIESFLKGASKEAGIPPVSSSPSPSSGATNKGVGLLGKNMGLTLINTVSSVLNNNKTTVTKEVNSLTSDIQHDLDKKPFSLKFNSTQSSFNAILKTLQSFSSKWGNAISDILSNTKLSFAGLSFKDGKLSFNPFKLINIKFFAEGGYPTSGDLFFANENGRAEYITSLGNKTAVANQDQMVSALTNAIVQGMSNLDSNRQPGITQVYIGNEKVYEGQGQYQNRQAERYGTAVIKI